MAELDKPTKGSLVRKKNTGELGIIIAVGERQNEALVFWGDGLTSRATLDDLEPMLFHPEAKIAAAFIEMVIALDTVRGYREVYPQV